MSTASTPQPIKRYLGKCHLHTRDPSAECCVLFYAHRHPQTWRVEMYTAEIATSFSAVLLQFRDTPRDRLSLLRTIQPEQPRFHSSAAEIARRIAVVVRKSTALDEVLHRAKGVPAAVCALISQFDDW